MPHPTEPPWTTHLTLDTLALILSRSLFHPFIALLIPLSLRACAKPYTDPALRLALLWAALVIAYHLLSALNARVAYGAPRELDWEDEVVVITGGGSGLGRVLAETYGMRGASVAVLDLRVPGAEIVKASEALAGVKWYACDVSKLEDVREAKQSIEKDLGPPTILINNAAAPVTSSPLATISPESTTRTLHTNLHGPFLTLHTFLPDLLARPNGATIVTVASVLGKLGAAHLAPYTASKAGLIALHRSLSAELRGTHVRAILVAPGQLATKLFAGARLPWYAHALGPVVEPVHLAREIVRMVDAGVGGEVSLPLYAAWIEWVFVLPAALQRGVRWLACIDTAMAGVGKKEK